MSTWIANNYTWVFSGVGVSAIGLVIYLFRRGVGDVGASAISNVNNINIENRLNGLDISSDNPRSAGMKTDEQVRKIKDSTRILFVDDDEKFKVVKILRNSGWTNTSLIKDVGSLDDRQVVAADIFFIDVQGVGIRLGFKDEGLGLAAALKDKYPEKRLVIYSAEPRGERFHKALRKADGALEKNADPYEFQQLVDEFAGIA